MQGSRSFLLPILCLAYLAAAFPASELDHVDIELPSSSEWISLKNKGFNGKTAFKGRHIAINSANDCADKASDTGKSMISVWQSDTKVCEIKTTFPSKDASMYIPSTEVTEEDGSVPAPFAKDYSFVGNDIKKMPSERFKNNILGESQWAAECDVVAQALDGGAPMHYCKQFPELKGSVLMLRSNFGQKNENAEVNDDEGTVGSKPTTDPAPSPSVESETTMTALDSMLDKKVEPVQERILFGSHVWGEEKFTVDSPATWNNQMSNTIKGAGFGEFVEVDEREGISGKVYVMDKARQVRDAKAFFLLTLMPHGELDLMTNDVIEKIADVMQEINEMGVPVLLRPMHEMNGSWHKWGQKPIQLIDVWKRLAKAVRSKAKLTSLVWSPNVHIGYPFSGPVDANTDELKALDTNKNGQLDEGDDPFGPYYPGPEYVDWIGLSYFFFGPYPFGRNAIPRNSELADGLSKIMEFVNSESAPGCGKAKPFGIFETAATYHPDPTDDKFSAAMGSEGQNMNVELKKNWLSQLTSSDARKLGVALVMWFEYVKDEDIGANLVKERDFALTRNQAVLAKAKEVLVGSAAIGV